MVSRYSTLSAVLLVGALAVACGDDHGSLTGPSSTQSTVAPAASQPPPPDPIVPGAPGPVREGPLGFADAVNLPPVVEWTLYRVPVTAKIEKAFDWDDDPSYDPVNTGGKHTRTENDDLLVTREGTTVHVAFNLKAFTCGRTQVDVSIDGVVWVHLVIKYGPCTPPPPPSTDCKAGVSQLRAFVQGQTAYVSLVVKDGYGQIPVTLTRWRFEQGAVWSTRYGAYFPQVKVSEVNRLLTGPWPAALSIEMDGSGQFDLSCGPGPDVLTEANAGQYESILLAGGVNDGGGWSYFP